MVSGDKWRHRLLGSLLLMAGLSALSGCAPPRSLNAKYILPPKAGIALMDVSFVEVKEPVVTIQGNYQEQGHEAAFRSYIKDRLSGLLYKERYLNASDEIYGNVSGSGKLGDVLRGKHGYNMIHSESPSGDKITITASTHITKDEKTEPFEISLTTVTYREIRKKEKDGTEKIESAPDKTTTRKITEKISSVVIIAKGSLACRLEKGQRRLYERAFNDLKFEKKIGGTGEPSALPTSIEIASALFDEPLSEIVKDISPHSEERPLVVNEKGEKTGVALIKAMAFSDAAEHLDKVHKEKESEIKSRRKEIASERDKKVADIQASTKAPEAKTKEIEKVTSDYDKKLQEAKSPISADYENYAICMEAMGYVGDAIEFYEKALDSDPGNQSAKSQLDKLAHLKAQVEKYESKKRSRN